MKRKSKSNPFARVKQHMTVTEAHCKTYGVGFHLVGHILVQPVYSETGHQVLGVVTIDPEQFSRRYNRRTWLFRHRWRPDMAVRTWRSMGLLPHGSH